MLVDEDADELVARAAVGIEEEVEQGVRIPLGGGFAGRVAAERHPVVLDEVDGAHVLNPLLREKGIKSLAGVPLVVDERVVGRPRTFTRDDVELLQLVAARAAVAIERTRVHEKLLRLDELRRNFVAIASHELRTPATSVYGALATLAERKGEPSPETEDQLLRVGYEQAGRLRRLVEQLLDLSRLDEQADTLDPRPLVLRTVRRRSRPGWSPAGAPVELRVPQDLAVVADRLVLDRVVSNLLANAARHGEPPIVVTAEQRDRRLRVGVEDAGSGVPEPLRLRIFDRFERGGDAQGAGLGLSIARAYARAHGGDLVYDPDASLSRFELIVPQ